MTEVVVRPGETDEYRIPFTHGWEKRQIVGRMRRLKVDVPREEARNANLNAKVDRIELSGVDTVRLTDVQTGGSTWTLTGYSAEWDANRAGFTPGGDVREGDDAALITELVGEVDSWTAGSIADLTGPLSFVFSHAHRHEALRRIETNVPGEIQFRDFGTVDYVDRLGTDRSGSVTLSSDAGTIEESIRITERGRELDGTHIRVLGAHEGEAQLYANLVPEADTDAIAAYDNVVTYSTSRWSEEADTDWDRWSDNDITDQDTLETEAESIGEELAETLVKAEAVVPSSVALNVGDTVRVVKPDADLDRDMRVHRLTRLAGTRNDTGSDAAVVDRVHLSTRTTLQTDDDETLEEIRKFNTGFQGSSVAVNAGPFGKAVDSGSPLEFNFKYPQLEFENSAQLHISGESYRIDSQGAASGGGVLSTSGTAGVFEESTTFAYANGSTQELTTQTVAIPDGSLTVNNSIFAFVDLDATSTLLTVEYIYVTDETENEIVGAIGPFDEDEILGAIPIDPTKSRLGNDLTITAALSDVPNDTWQVGLSTGTQRVHDHQINVPDHTHDPQPGIFTTGDTPSNVDVAINGTTVATNIGSGSFETVIDVSGEFTNDAWNTVEVSSDSLGIVEVSAFVEGYDQIGRNV